MKITQATVDRIIARAKTSDFGLGDGLTHKNGHNQISQYGEHNLKALGMLLVNGYDAKYDLISVFIAALEIIAEDAPTAKATTPDKQRDSLPRWPLSSTGNNRNEASIDAPSARVFPQPFAN